jgi:hypothetical protein
MLSLLIAGAMEKAASNRWRSARQSNNRIWIATLLMHCDKSKPLPGESVESP